jgi:hypothetical protein
VIAAEAAYKIKSWPTGPPHRCHFQPVVQQTLQMSYRSTGLTRFAPILEAGVDHQEGKLKRFWGKRGDDLVLSNVFTPTTACEHCT